MGKKKEKQKVAAPPRAAVELTPQQKAARTRAQAKREAERLAKADQERLAQVANLMIAGHTFESIGSAIGATPAEVERMMTQDMARYVRTQPALRVFVRNFLGEKYTKLLDAVWDEATDRNHPQKLENQVAAVRILERMGKLHGADMPTQSEIKVESAPEAVERLVQALSASQGLAYDVNIFDVVDGEVVDDAVEETEAALLDASERVGEQADDDEEWDDA